jgi:methylated-DNA-[protein]-cysteine S-methyltransferase
MFYVFVIDTVLGNMLLAENGSALTHIIFNFDKELDNVSAAEAILAERNKRELKRYSKDLFSNKLLLSPDDISIKDTPLLLEAGKQIKEYLSGERKYFDLPYQINGTEFQKKVWKALLEIPYGETRSYGEIARHIGKEKASRAVGMANNRNPLPIIIPCHRVIGFNGKLVGYGGGLHIKSWLLNLESKNKYD